MLLERLHCRVASLVWRMMIWVVTLDCYCWRLMEVLSLVWKLWRTLGTLDVSIRVMMDMMYDDGDGESTMC
jgi:hypothetical protein